MGPSLPMREPPSLAFRRVVVRPLQSPHAYREVSVIDVSEILQLWLEGRACVRSPCYPG
jgi:hypothetical protein